MAALKSISFLHVLNCFNYKNLFNELQNFVAEKINIFTILRLNLNIIFIPEIIRGTLYKLFLEFYFKFVLNIFFINFRSGVPTIGRILMRQVNDKK